MNNQNDSFPLRPSQPGRAGSETAGWIGVIKKMGEEQRTPSSPSQVTQSAKPDERALVRLESDLRSIKDDANENGAGNPPDGYGYLDQNSQAIADACFRLGLDSMETALSNWIYDQRNLAPAPSTLEGLKVTQQINEMFATSQPLTTEQETALAEHVGNVMNDAVREERDTANRLKALISEALSPAPFSGESELHDSLKAAYVERILTAIAPFIPASTTEVRK